jgi:hypothetical protein
MGLESDGVRTYSAHSRRRQEYEYLPLGRYRVMGQDMSMTCCGEQSALCSGYALSSRKRVTLSGVARMTVDRFGSRPARSPHSALPRAPAQGAWVTP